MSIASQCYLYSTLACDPELEDDIEEFVEDMPACIERLERTLQASLWDEVGRLAHRLQAPAANLGFGALKPLAARLEQAARGGEPEEAIRQAVERLLSVCRRVRGSRS